MLSVERLTKCRTIPARPVPAAAAARRPAPRPAAVRRRGRQRHVARRQPRRPAAGLGKLEQQVVRCSHEDVSHVWHAHGLRRSGLHNSRRTAPPGGRSRPCVRFSVTATSRQSASSGYHAPSGTPAKMPCRGAAVQQLVDAAAGHADDELLERRPGEGRREPAAGGQPLGRVAGLLQAQARPPSRSPPGPIAAR